MDNPLPPRRFVMDIPDRMTVILGALAILGDTYVEKWLSTPHPALDGLTPDLVLDNDDPTVRQGVAMLLVNLHSAGPDAVATERHRLDLA